MNERDSEQVARDLVARGYIQASHEKEADVILLNTCSVREMAESKAIGKMGFLKKNRRQNPQLVLGFLGCMAQRLGSELTKKTPHIDLVVGTQKFHRVADYVEEAIERRKKEVEEESLQEIKDLSRPFLTPIVDVEIEEGSQNTIKEHLTSQHNATAFISIMQGCNMHCTFCIVPTTRGPERGRPIEEIVQEAKTLVAGGVKEVTLLGQIVNQYARHEIPKKDGKSPFVQLLEALHEVEGLERIRFTSPHPMGFRSDLVECIGRLPKIMEHIHFPLQSGSDRILKKMHRPYTVDKYRNLVADLRAARPGIAITTDIIVAFPGETEEEYLMTKELAKELRFDNAFIFRYSQRGDTPAALMEDQLSEEIKEARNKDLLEDINEVASEKLNAYVGTLQEILCEGRSRNDPTRLMGRTRTNKIVIFEGSFERFYRKIFQVRITRASSSTLYGDPAVIE